MNYNYLLALMTGITLTLSGCSTSFQENSKTNTCPSYKAYYKADCDFCRIVAGQAPAQVLYEDDIVIAFFKKTRPVVGVDCLIIPKKHIENIKFLDDSNDCDAKIMGRMFMVAKILSQRLSGSGDFKIIINNGEHAGQTQFHLHMHFISSDDWRVALQEG